MPRCEPFTILYYYRLPRAQARERIGRGLCGRGWRFVRWRCLAQRDMTELDDTRERWWPAPVRHFSKGQGNPTSHHLIFWSPASHLHSTSTKSHTRLHHTRARSCMYGFCRVVVVVVVLGERNT